MQIVYACMLWYFCVWIKDEFISNTILMIMMIKVTIMILCVAYRPFFEGDEVDHAQDYVPHSTVVTRIGHFRVPKILAFKMRPSSQPFLWKWVLFAREWKITSISKVEHLTSFWYRGPGEHGNGPLLWEGVAKRGLCFIVFIQEN